MIFLVVLLAFAGGALMDFTTGTWGAGDVAGEALVFTAAFMAAVVSVRFERLRDRVRRIEQVVDELGAAGHAHVRD